jgi:hypothetical protein
MSAKNRVFYGNIKRFVDNGKHRFNMSGTAVKKSWVPMIAYEREFDIEAYTDCTDSQLLADDVEDILRDQGVVSVKNVTTNLELHAM